MDKANELAQAHAVVKQDARMLALLLLDARNHGDPREFAAVLTDCKVFIQRAEKMLALHREAKELEGAPLVPVVRFALVRLPGEGDA